MDSIGNYKIVRTIVEKGPSRVCIAEHKKLGRKTFLKIYSGADTDLIQRFEREARIVAELDHESIVSIYDFGESEGKYYISMEYVEGCNLSEFLKSNTLSVDRIINFSYQISKSVSVIHEKGYTHRDLKPENILIDRNNDVKITDFGIAFHQALNHVTNEGNVLGTPLYMSPEQINNLHLSSVSDVFSLGIIFYQMAAGTNPFEAERYGEIFSKILTIQPKSLKNINSDLPDWYVNLVDRMLQKDSKKRLQDAGQVCKEIQNRQKQKVEDVNIESEVSRREHIKRFPKWKLFMPITALLIVLIIFSYSKFGKNDKQNVTEQPIISNPDSSLFTSAQLNKLDNTVQSIPGSDVGEKAAITITDRTKEQANLNQTENSADLSKNVKPATTFLIETWPWCRVYLNYEFIDETQMKEPKNIKPGNYLLSLQNPNYPTWSDSISINPNQLNTFSFNLDSIFFKLVLNVSPWGEVFIDGKRIGMTPIKPVYLTRKNHFIQIKNEFYETWQDSLTWNGEDLIEKRIKLKSTD